MSAHYHSFATPPSYAPSKPRATGNTIPPQYRYRRDVSASPPEASDTLSGSSRSGSRSSVSSSSYHGSSRRRDSRPPSSGSSQSVRMDVNSYADERMAGSYDPMALDRSLAAQARSSGALNAKNRELAELQALAQARLSSTRANIADGIRAAKEVRRDLEWTQGRVASLNARAQARYPDEYRRASDRYPRIVDDE